MSIATGMPKVRSLITDLLVTDYQKALRSQRLPEPLILLAPGFWRLAPPLHPSPLLDLDLILHFGRRAKSLDETEVAGARCGYLE